MADCDNTTAVVFAIIFGVITGLFVISSCWSVCDGAQRPGRRSHPPPKDDPRFPYFMSETTGLWLYRSVTMPPPGVEPKALVVFSHGYAEYCDRYAAAAREFAKRGVIFWAFDFEGHGRSDGERGFVTPAGFGAFVDDAEQALRIAAAEFEDIPIFLMGHSLGGLVTVHLGTRLCTGASPSGGGAVSGGRREPLLERIQGVVLSAPAMEVDPEVAKPHLVFIASLLGSCMPRLRMGSIPATTLTNNAVVNDDYTRNSMINTRPFAARFAVGVLQKTAEVEELLADFRLPVLGMQDREDRTTVPGACERFVHKCGSPDATFEWISGFKHELLMADGYDKLIDTTIVPWMKSRAPTWVESEATEAVVDADIADAADIRMGELQAAEAAEEADGAKAGLIAAAPEPTGTAV